MKKITILVGEYMYNGFAEYFLEPQYFIYKRNTIPSKKHADSQYKHIALLQPRYQYLMQEQYKILSNLRFTNFTKTLHAILDIVKDLKKTKVGWGYSYKMLHAKDIVNTAALKHTNITKHDIVEQYPGLKLHEYIINYFLVINILGWEEIKKRLGELHIQDRERKMFIKFLQQIKDCDMEKFDEDVEKLYDKIIMEIQGEVR